VVQRLDPPLNTEDHVPATPLRQRVAARRRTISGEG
jgi:hypothetical protein